MINTHEGYLHVKNLVEDLFAEENDKDAIIVKMTNDAEFLRKQNLLKFLHQKLKIFKYSLRIISK